MAVVAVVVTAVGALWTASSTVGGRYRTVRVDNGAGPALQVDVTAPRRGPAGAGPGRP